MHSSVPLNPKKRSRNEIANNQEKDQFNQELRMTREQHRRVDEIQEQLAFLDRREMIKLKPQKPKPLPTIKHRRNLSLEEHRRVIFLRFGSLDSFERMHYTSKEVFLMTDVRPSTQYNIIKRWLQHGKQVITLVGDRGPEKMLSYSDRVYIANPRTLMQQRHLNLEQRAHVIKRELNLP